MSGDKFYWVPQPGTVRSSASDGTGTRSFNFLADLDTGRDAALKQGYLEGQQTQIDGETYELTRIEVRPFEEAFDMVTITYQSIHGPTPSGSVRKHKPNDQEWRLAVSTKPMSATEALDKGYIESLSEVTGDPDLTTVHVPVPTLLGKVWLRGVKNEYALPRSSAAALTKYAKVKGPDDKTLLGTIGQPLGDGLKWYCTDLNTEAEGALLVINYTYEWQPKGFIVTKVPS